MLGMISKYKHLSRPAKASLWFALSSIVQKGISTLTTPIFTRILSTAEYGTISIYNSWYAILTIFATYELATGVFNKAMIKYEDDRDAYTSSTLVLSSLITLAFFVVYLLFRTSWNQMLQLNTFLMVMMFIEVFFTEAMLFWSVRQRFEFRYISVVVITLISNIFGSALSLFLVLIFRQYAIEMKILGAVIVHIVAYGLVFIVILKRGKRIIVPSYWKYAIRYNTPLIPHYFSQQMLNQLDRIMISRIVGMGAAAKYSVAYTLAMLLNLVTDAIGTSFSPWAFQSIRDRKFEQIGKMTNQIVITLSLACFGFSLCAPELVLFLGGKKYIEAIWIVPPVAMSIVFNMLYSLIANFAFYFEKTKFVMYGTLMAAGMNFLLNLVFIPKFGFIAAGYTTLGCYVFYSIIHYIFMLKICKDNQIKNPFNGVILWSICFAAVLLSILSSLLYQFIVFRYIVLVILGVMALLFRNQIIRLVKM